MALVLCTGADRVLMETRKLIVEREGHTVVLVMSEPELNEACAKHSFDIAIIGQGISRKMKKVVAALIRESCPSVKILELHLPHEGRGVDDADSWLEVPPEGAHQLAERVNELAAEKVNGAKA